KHIRFSVIGKAYLFCVVIQFLCDPAICRRRLYGILQCKRMENGSSGKSHSHGKNQQDNREKFPKHLFIHLSHPPSPFASPCAFSADLPKLLQLLWNKMLSELHLRTIRTCREVRCKFHLPSA